MSFPSHYIDLLKYSKKNLLLDYQIEKVRLSFFGRVVNMNNWLSFKDWLEIYEKIDTILDEQSDEASGSDCLCNFTRTDFFISNNSVKVEVVKEKFESSFAKIFPLSERHFYNFVLRIYITVVKNKTQQNILCKENVEVTKLVESGHCKKPKGEFTPEPYNPVKTKLKDDVNSNTIRYTPSTIPQEEPYTPQPILNNEENVSPDLFSSQKTHNNCDNYPVYKASPISNQDQDITKFVKDRNVGRKKKRPTQDSTLQEQRETRSKRRFDLLLNSSDNRNVELSSEEIEKKNVDACDKNDKFKRTDLFGSDDSETEFEYGTKKNFRSIYNAKKSEASTLKLKTRKKQKKPVCINKKNSNSSKTMDKWLGTAKLEKPTEIPIIFNEPCSSSFQINTNTDKIRVSVEQRKLNRAKHEKDMQAIAKLNDVMKSALTHPSNVVLKTLNHLSVSQVLSTFYKYENLLTEHFEASKLAKQRNIPKIEDLDYMALQNFIPEQHLLEMCTFLRENYESVEGVPKFTDLYMNLLIPEWVLAIFMEEHKMNRKDALRQITDQEELNTIPTQMMDNSSFNFSKLN